jgi:transcriptional regulator with XRE-family HTH domain
MRLAEIQGGAPIRQSAPAWALTALARRAPGRWRQRRGGQISGLHAPTFCKTDGCVKLPVELADTTLSGSAWQNTPMARKKWYLQQWREYRGISQTRLADQIAISRSRISELESGKARYNQDLLERLADALNCEPADLLMRDPTAPNPWGTVFDAVRRIPVEELPRAQAVIEALAPKAAAKIAPNPARAREAAALTGDKPKRLRLKRKAG